jgi:tRNA (guanine37-N1)-methyltransferase
VFEGRAIPEVLTSGDHAKVARWRREEAERLTRARRPDLWAAYRQKQMTDG